MAVKYLRTEDLPIAELITYPGNARRGNIPMVRESVRVNTQYRALVVREQGTNGSLRHTILCGNNTREALANEGYAKARCEIIECDDADAKRINSADNKLNDQATWDLDALQAQVEAFQGEYAGTGWTEEAAEKFLRRDVPASDDSDMSTRYELVVELATEEAQAELFTKLTAEGYRCRVLIL